MNVFDKYIERASTLDSILLTRNEFGNIWPFKEAVVELKHPIRDMPVVEIKGVQYGLNGFGCMKLGISNPHDAEVAILGKSIGGFRDIALVLNVGA